MKNVIFIILFLGGFIVSFGQSPLTKGKTAGYSVQESDSIKSLASFYSTNFQLTGYRVQIGTSSNRRGANKIQSDFLSKFPNMSSYESYQAPVFKIRVGDFHSYLDAYGLRSEIINEFPSAFIVEIKGIEFKQQ